MLALHFFTFHFLHLHHIFVLRGFEAKPTTTTTPEAFNQHNGETKEQQENLDVETKGDEKPLGKQTKSKITNCGDQWG